MKIAAIITDHSLLHAKLGELFAHRATLLFILINSFKHSTLIKRSKSLRVFCVKEHHRLIQTGAQNAERLVEQVETNQGGAAEGVSGLAKVLDCSPILPPERAHRNEAAVLLLLPGILFGDDSRAGLRCLSVHHRPSSHHLPEAGRGPGWRNRHIAKSAGHRHR